MEPEPSSARLELGSDDGSSRPGPARCDRGAAARRRAGGGGGVSRRASSCQKEEELIATMSAAAAARRPPSTHSRGVRGDGRRRQRALRSGLLWKRNGLAWRQRVVVLTDRRAVYFDPRARARGRSRGIPPRPRRAGASAARGSTSSPATAATTSPRPRAPRAAGRVDRGRRGRRRRRRGPRSSSRPRTSRSRSSRGRARRAAAAAPAGPPAPGRRAHRRGTCGRRARSSMKRRFFILGGTVCRTIPTPRRRRGPPKAASTSWRARGATGAPSARASPRARSVRGCPFRGCSASCRLLKCEPGRPRRAAAVRAIEDAVGGRAQVRARERALCLLLELHTYRCTLTEKTTKNPISPELPLAHHARLPKGPR